MEQITFARTREPITLRPFTASVTRHKPALEMMKIKIRSIIYAAVILAATGLNAETRLLRFPDITGDLVAFCYGGDLWKASTDGGRATRLTAHPGQELFPKFSPDGEWIAFTGQYDGDEQVYVMPTAGGMPQQLTYYPAAGPLPPRWGYDHQVYGWTPDGKNVLFRSLRDADGGKNLTALYTVRAEGGLPVMLPMPTSGAGDFSPDGNQLLYSPLFRDFRTWKRYEGGWAQDLFVFDLENNTATAIDNSVRTERDPMWIGEGLYYASDRGGRLNLYRYDRTTQSSQALTNHQEWDVRWPSSDGESRIVFESNGVLAVYDIKTASETRLSITVPDDGLAMRPSRYSAADNIEDYELSPKGNRALFVARGDIFTTPIEKGSTRNLTNSSNAHDKHARWSPDGRKIAFVSDLSGEEQLHLIDQDGRGEPEALTTDHRVMLSAPAWSPDSQHLAYSDKDGKLFILTIETKRVVEIVDSPRGGISDYTWSACSGHLAFTMWESNDFGRLHLWSMATGDVTAVTDPHFDVGSPTWDPEGHYLYYLSRREFAPQISSIEWNYAGSHDVQAYALALRKDVENPFAPESDEVEIEEDEESDDQPSDQEDEEAKESDSEKKDKEESSVKPIVIDFEGLAQRTVRIPIPAGNIRALAATDGFLFYSTSGARFYGRSSLEKSTLHVFDLEERESKSFMEGASGWALSSDGTKILVRAKGGFARYDAKPGASGKETVSTSGLMVDRKPSEEWLTIFNEVWRRFRDFFYVENMHGFDWEAIGEQYRPLVKHVAHRSDLNYVIGEMISELNVGHAYIAGGDFEIPDRPKVALPGARFELDSKADRYRIARIFNGHNEESKYRSPLTEVGVDGKEGDYLIAIDGKPLAGADNPYRLLQHKTDPVVLTVNDRPIAEGAREVTYRPVASEKSLLYLNWVLANQAKVDALTSGKVGYLHIPDMGGSGIYEFIKWFYPQIRKEGLIVDVRSNGGGNVSQWIIERLDTKLLGTRFGYSSDEPGTYPATVFHGHKVCLMNETSASDGDIFPHRFRKSGLGPLIGKRSWGGVVGISSRGPLLDGGTVYVPLQATNDTNGDYIIEGHGVDPDIIVDNDPQSVIEGRDPQLERGVQEVLRRMAETPMKLPNRPPDPVKTK